MGKFGKSQLDYAQVFAALGRYITREELTNTCVMEFEGGIIVVGSKLFAVGENLARHTLTRVFSEQDLRQLIKVK